MSSEAADSTRGLPTTGAMAAKVASTWAAEMVGWSRGGRPDRRVAPLRQLADAIRSGSATTPDAVELASARLLAVLRPAA